MYHHGTTSTILGPIEVKKIKVLLFSNLIYSLVVVDSIIQQIQFIVLHITCTSMAVDATLVVIIYLKKNAADI